MDWRLRRAYAILELSPPVGATIAKRRYHEPAKRWHPDRYSADPIGQAVAAVRMRQINDAFHLVAAALETEFGTRDSTSELSKPISGFSSADVERIVTSINRSQTFTLWPRMSRSRWLSLAAVLAYLVFAAFFVAMGSGQEALAISRAVGLAFGYFWLPLFLIWKAEADNSSHETRVVFRTLGWVLMSGPGIVGLWMWAWG